MTVKAYIKQVFNNTSNILIVSEDPISRISQEKTILIGTANFAQSYGGVTSPTGLSQRKINEIFQSILSNNLGIDSSPSYGDAQIRLGKLIEEYGFSGYLMTKIPTENYVNSKQIFTSATISLKQLRVQSVDSILLHGYGDYFRGNIKSIRDGLRMILDEGLARRVGLSCYEESEIIQAKEEIPTLSVFQVPSNVLDHRLLKSDALEVLSSSNNVFFVRSAFLQGMLLREVESLPLTLKDLSIPIKHLTELARASGVSLLDYCLAFVKNISWSSGLILGVESADQISHILESIKLKKDLVFESFQIPDHIIDPRKWII